MGFASLRRAKRKAAWRCDLHGQAFADGRASGLAAPVWHDKGYGEFTKPGPLLMIAKPLILVLAMLTALPAYGQAGAPADVAVAVASADAPGDLPSADLSAGVVTDSDVAPDPQPKKKLFGIFAPKSAAEKAALKAERQAARDEKKRAGKGDYGQASSSHEAKRAEVKDAVAVAIANRPKGRLWCVPFARAVSGVDIRGNAKTWWAQAKGMYERGREPQVGAVMAFAASRAMPKGHVAVVSKVVSDREILVDQANWERDRVTLDTLVVDVSATGDWSAVKVANPNGTLGRVNPINGFIYK